jgi:hypothetical protein
MADIVDDFLTRLQQHVPDLPAHIPLELERNIRAEWGGNKPYVGKQVSRVTRASLVAAGLRQGKPLRECFAQAGVARRTGYRILGSK